MMRFNSTDKELLWTSGDYLYASVVLPVSAKVIDLGGGQSPHVAAQVILDKYWDDSSHRMGGIDSWKGGGADLLSGNLEKVGETEWKPTLVGGDFTDLPFADKSFDFAICNCALEHVEDPVRACREMSRIAKAGFIEVPRFISEWLYPQGEIHKYVFDEIDGKLIASKVNFQSPYGRLLHEAHWTVPGFMDAWAKSRLVFHLVKFWKDEISCEVR